MLAHDRQIYDVHDGTRTALIGSNIDPSMLVLGHRRGIAFELVADVLILVRQRAQIAVCALGHVDD
jgi:hypothetical protein